MMLAFIGIVFFGTVAIGVPVAFGMGLAGASWILFFEGLEPSILARRLYFALGSFPLLAIPLFIMLGFLADRTKMLPHLITWLRMLLGRMRGGMAYINVVASMLFAGVSGTAVSDVASLGRIEVQMMSRAGYPVAYSAALTSATSIIAPIIPPSVAMIIYALAVGNISVGAMFMAGIIPGLMFAGGFLVMAWFTTRRNNYGSVLERPERSELLRQTLRVVPFLVLPVIIVGGIRFGVFTVTESAAIGVSYVLIFGFLNTPRLTLRDVYEATVYSAVTSSVAGMLLGAGAILAWIMTYNGVTQTLTDFLLALTSSPLVYMLLVAVILLILGMLMDAVPIMIALAPLLAPIAKTYGIPDVQFALVFIITCMIGLVTPPVGIILFMMSSIANVQLEKLALEAIPFVIWMITVLILMILFPPLTLWLPEAMGMR